MNASKQPSKKLAQPVSMSAPTEASPAKIQGWQAIGEHLRQVGEKQAQARRAQPQK